MNQTVGVEVTHRPRGIAGGFVSVPDVEVLSVHDVVQVRIARIADSTQLQATSAGEVKQAIRSVSDTTESNAAAAEELAASAEQLGHGAGYEYPHDDERGWVDQQYLPDELRDRRWYEPSRHGDEARVRDRMNRRVRPRDDRRHDAPVDDSGERDDHHDDGGAP